MGKENYFLGRVELPEEDGLIYDNFINSGLKEFFNYYSPFMEEYIKEEQFLFKNKLLLKHVHCISDMKKYEYLKSGHFLYNILFKDVSKKLVNVEIYLREIHYPGLIGIGYCYFLIGELAN